MIKVNGFSAVTVALTLTLAGCGGGGGGGNDPASGGAAGSEDGGSQQQEPGTRESLNVLSPTLMEKVTVDADVFRPDVAISDAGKALAVWAEDVNGTLRLVAVEGDAEEGTWSSKTFLDDGKGLLAPSETWLSTQVTMDASGNAVIAWIQSVEESEATHLKTIDYSLESGFDTPVDHGPTTSFHLKGNDSGDVLIVWETEFAPGQNDISAAFRPSGASSWDATKNLTNGAITEEYVSATALYLSRIAMNEAGEATLFYKGKGSVVESTSTKLQTLYRNADGIWDFPEPLVEGATALDVVYFATEIDENGNRFSGWIQSDTDGIQIMGVTGGADILDAEAVEYYSSAENTIRLEATYRDTGALFVAAEQEMNSQGLRPLVTVEVIGEEVNPEVYDTGGRYLRLESAGNRVVSLGRNRCSTGMGVRESLEQRQLMSEPFCSEGNAKENIELAITPDRAGVFAGIGTILDDSTFPATRHDVIELNFFR